MSTTSFVNLGKEEIKSEKIPNSGECISAISSSTYEENFIKESYNENNFSLQCCNTISFRSLRNICLNFEKKLLQLTTKNNQTYFIDFENKYSDIKKFFSCLLKSYEIELYHYYSMIFERLKKNYELKDVDEIKKALDKIKSLDLKCKKNKNIENTVDSIGEVIENTLDSIEVKKDKNEMKILNKMFGNVRTYLEENWEKLGTRYDHFTTMNSIKLFNFYKLNKHDAKNEEGKIENDDICDSYPYWLDAPRGTDANELKVVAKTRSKFRLPIYTWKTADYKKQLLRGSMPNLIKDNLSIRNSPCKKYLDKCLTEDRKWMLIVDCRSRLAALANIFRNGGFEKYGYRYYTVYLNIENVDKVFSAFEQLTTKLLLDQNDIQNFINNDFPKLEYTKFLRLIIDGAFLVADNLKKGVPVLVHCTRGYDRTPQITSLAKLIMDQYYRTVYGFIQLIFEDWIIFSHKFSQKECTFPNFPRLFFINKAEKKCARVFIQFLDVVHQIYEANPNKFGFTKELLIDIANNMDHELFWFNKNSNRPDPEKSLEKFKDLFKKEKYSKHVYEVDDNFYYPSKLKLWKDYYCDKSCEKDVEDVNTEYQVYYVGKDIDCARKCYYIMHLLIPAIAIIYATVFYILIYKINLTTENFIIYRKAQGYSILVINSILLLMNNFNIYISETLLLYTYSIICFIFLYGDYWWNHIGVFYLAISYSIFSIILKIYYNILPVDNLCYNIGENFNQKIQTDYYY